MFKHLGFGLNIIALGLFFPGILLPMFNLEMVLAASLSGSATISSDLVNQELSIMQTVEELWSDQRLLVAALIFAFSVCIPLFKTIMVSIAYFAKSDKIEQRLLRFVGAIGKWSMADVFVVAVFLAVLSTNHAETASQQQFSIFGFEMALDISSQTLSNVGEGFYYFVGYCLVSLTGTHLALLGLNAPMQTELHHSEAS
ncbi:MAG: paraquat-inducible protein A [Pseudomonadota bacterium]